jgi:ribonuclease D
MPISLDFSPSTFLSKAKHYGWVTDDTVDLITRAAMSARGPIGVDTEFNAPGMLLHGVRPDLVQIAIPDGTGYCNTFLCLGERVALLAPLLSSDKAKVMHMSYVDRTVLRNAGVETPNTECTYSLARRFTSRDDLSLKGLAGNYLGLDLGKFSQFKGRLPADLVAERDADFLEYSALDPALTVLVYDRISQELERQR